MDFMLGKKIGMSRTYDESGKVIPVTVLEVGPCTVTQVKNDDKDGYTAVQIGYAEAKKISKPMQGHLKNLKKKFVGLKEMRIKFKKEDYKLPKVGDVFTVESFATGDKVKVTSTSKGRGFAGVVKRHGFAGSPKTHGHRHDERAPGSIGAAFPQHVMKGMKMAGRMGNERVTISNLEVATVDVKKNILAVKGSVPGAKGKIVQVRKVK
ncbi:MAG: 50S ribosomal protein L3 [bacterium]